MLELEMVKFEFVWERHSAQRETKACVLPSEDINLALNWFPAMVFIVLGVVMKFDMLAWSCSFRHNLSRLVHLHQQNNWIYLNTL